MSYVPTARAVALVLAVVCASFVPPAAADPPCRPLQPPRPICVPDLPAPSLPSIPSVPSPPNIPSVPTLPSTAPVPSALPIPSVVPVPSVAPIPSATPTAPGLPQVPVPTLGPLPQVPPGPSPSGPVGVLGWLPANAGVMWWQGADTFGIPPAQPPGEPGGSWWLTRRIGVSPLLPEVQHLGSLFHGMYLSTGGGAWVNLSPGCLLPLRSPLPQLQDLYRPLRQLAVAATGLDACGVEGIAYDPLLPNRIFASAYTVEDVSLSGALLGEGGVYVSDNLGVSWRKLVGGLRGNGLAVARAGTGPARIVAGYIQAHNGSIGNTPGNGSLSISDDDGRTWRNVVLPSSGCTEAVPTTQRITPTVAMPPDDPTLIYVGTNAGLYASTNGGSSFTLLRQACGGTWGVALSPDSDRVWIGDHEGRILRADTGSSSFTQLTDLGAGKVQHLLLDRDGRTLFAAMWDGGGASVYRIDGQTGARAQLGHSLLEPIDRLPVPKPFPLGPEMSNGTMPSLFLGRPYGRLQVSTVLRGIFVRLE